MYVQVLRKVLRDSNLVFAVTASLSNGGLQMRLAYINDVERGVGVDRKAWVRDDEKWEHVCVFLYIQKWAFNEERWQIFDHFHGNKNIKLF